MNLNLNRIKSGTRVFLLILSVFPISEMFGQSKTNISYGLSVSPGMGYAIVSSNAYDKYKDTSDSKTTGSFLRGAHVWIKYSINRKTDLQAGIGFQQIGFARIQKGLKYSDRTYPGIGSGFVLDASNSTKEITYNYRFSNIQLPFLFNFYTGRSSDNKWNFTYCLGGSFNLLMKHRIVANMNQGYTIEGKDQYKLDSTGFDARFLSFSLNTGFKAEYKDKESKGRTYFIQPMVGLFPISTSSGSTKSYPVYLYINLGMFLVKN